MNLIRNFTPRHFGVDGHNAKYFTDYLGNIPFVRDLHAVPQRVSSTHEQKFARYEPLKTLGSAWSDSHPVACIGNRRSHRLHLAALNAGVFAASVVAYLIVVWDEEASSPGLLIPSLLGTVALVGAVGFLLAGLFTPRTANRALS